MTNHTTDHIDHDGNGLHITRPGHLTDDQWTQLRRSAEAYLQDLVAAWQDSVTPVGVQCPDRAWCMMGGPSCDHSTYHCSDSIELDAGTGAWLTETRPDGPAELIIEGPGGDAILSSSTAAVLLAATETTEAREALLQLLEQADERTATTHGVG